jgi:hypothetical protein
MSTTGVTEVLGADSGTAGVAAASSDDDAGADTASAAAASSAIGFGSGSRIDVTLLGV